LPTEVTFQDPKGILDGGEPKNTVEELPAIKKETTSPSEIDFIEPTDQDNVVVITDDGPQPVTMKKTGKTELRSLAMQTS